VIALVWAAAAGGYYGGVEGLAAALTHGPSFVVHDVCTNTLGTLGGILAILGVVVLPITSGDTAFRVGRLIAADYLGLPQKRKLNRYLIALPLFAVSLSLNFISFDVIWRYFGWANQSLAAVTLWAAAVFLARRGSYWWIAALPAVFMTVMTTTFLLVEERKNGCLGLGHGLGTAIGLGLGAVCFAAFLFMLPKMRRERESKQAEIASTGSSEGR
jgi:carbon starvation protein CstA